MNQLDMNGRHAVIGLNDGPSQPIGYQLAGLPMWAEHLHWFTEFELWAAHHSPGACMPASGGRRSTHLGFNSAFKPLTHAFEGDPL